jgi:uncharacterized protein (DUF58 family)
MSKKFVLENFVINKIEQWFHMGANRQQLNPPPWEKNSFLRELIIPWHLRTSRVNGALYALGGLFLFIIGYFSSSKILGAIGFGIFATICLAWRSLWIQSGFLNLTSQNLTLRSRENDRIFIEVKVNNTGKNWSEPSLIYAKFPGSVPEESYIGVDRIAPKSTHTLKIPLLLNRGMGEYTLESLQLVVRDPLGIFISSIQTRSSIEVIVDPAHESMEKIHFESLGSTMHSGVFQSRRSGDSSTFLGLRPFRSGDMAKRIDWRRSHRHNELIVRDFEQLSCTDAIVIVDCRNDGLFRYGSINSFEAIKDTAISVIESVVAQQLRIKLITESVETHLGKGRSHFEFLCEVIRDIDPVGVKSYIENVRNSLELSYPGTVLIPIFFQEDTDLGELYELMVVAESSQVEVIPVMIHTDSFQSAIVVDSGFTPQEIGKLDSIKFEKEQNTKKSPYRISPHMESKIVSVYYGATIASSYGTRHA